MRSGPASWRDVMPSHLVLVGPSQNGVRGQLRAVVPDDGPRLAALGEEPIDLASDPNARDIRARVVDPCQILTRTFMFGLLRGPGIGKRIRARQFALQG